MIILACATKRECLSALSALNYRPQAWPALVNIGGCDMLACIVGIGPVAAALNIGALLERYPQAIGIINLGICGTYNIDDMPMACPCIADAEIFPEYGVRFSDTTPEEIFGHQMLQGLSLYPPNHLDLAPSTAARAMNLNLPDSWPVGRSLTVSGVSGDLDRAAKLRARYNASTENMEGFALALAARNHNIAFLEIRTVSNPAGVQDKGAWDVRQALTSLGSVLPTLTSLRR